MAPIDSRRVYGSSSALVGRTAVEFVEERGRGFQVTLRVTAISGTDRSECVVTNMRVLWEPGRLRKGVTLVHDGHQIAIRRNRPRLLRRHRRIDVTGGGLDWVVRGRLGRDEICDQQTGVRLWERTSDLDAISDGASPSEVCLLMTLLYGKVFAALRPLPALAG